MAETSNAYYSSVFRSNFVLWRQSQYTVYDLKPQRLRLFPLETTIPVRSLWEYGVLFWRFTVENKESEQLKWGSHWYLTTVRKSIIDGP